jgi:hypothetical protein
MGYAPTDAAPRCDFGLKAMSHSLKDPDKQSYATRRLLGLDISAPDWDTFLLEQS